MIRLLSRAMKLPLAAFVSSMESLVKAMREVQRVVDRSIDAAAGGVVQIFGDVPDSSSIREGETTNPGNIDTISYNTEIKQVTNHKEEGQMTDLQDLSGDDLKYVSYSILFTKRDLEVTLEEQKEELVNYSTDGASFGGLKIADFMARVKDGKIDRPPLWKENDYPCAGADDRKWEFPIEDRKFVTFVFRVDRRMPRQEPEYDRDQVKVLRGIRDKI